MHLARSDPRLRIERISYGKVVPGEEGEAYGNESLYEWSFECMPRCYEEAHEADGLVVMSY